MTATADHVLDTEQGDWREFDDRDARQDAIARDLEAALDEPGF